MTYWSHILWFVKWISTLYLNIVLCFYYPGSRYSRRNTNVMLVWISCFSVPWLLHKILLVFNSVCALWGGSINLFQCAFSDLFSVPSCSQYSNPAAQSLIQPFVHIFCGSRPTKDVHQNMSSENGEKEKVFPFSLPLIISKLGFGQGIATCTTPLPPRPQSPLKEL